MRQKDVKNYSLLDGIKLLIFTHPFGEFHRSISGDLRLKKKKIQPLYHVGNSLREGVTIPSARDGVFLFKCMLLVSA